MSERAMAAGDAAVEVVERACGAALVVNAERRILACNAEAAAVLREADALADASGRLVALRAADDARLQSAVEASLQPPLPAAQPAALPLPRRSGRADYVLLLSRLRGAGEPRLLVLVHDFEAQPALGAPMLEQCFGLTPAEARIAAHLAQGHDPVQTAQRLRLSLNTVRTHLRGIYRKTGSTGQAELARRFAALAAAAASAGALAGVSCATPRLRLVQPDETESFTGGRRVPRVAVRPDQGK